MILDRPRSLCEALRRGLIPKMHLTAAMQILISYTDRPRKPTWALPARSLYNDPSWDDAVRILERDK